MPPPCFQFYRGREVACHFCSWILFIFFHAADAAQFGVIRDIYICIASSSIIVSDAACVRAAKCAIKKSAHARALRVCTVCAFRIFSFLREASQTTTSGRETHGVVMAYCWDCRVLVGSTSYYGTCIGPFWFS